MKLNLIDKTRTKAPHVQERSALDGEAADYWATLSVADMERDFTVTEMKEKAKALGLSGYSKLRQTELAELIFNHYQDQS